MTRPVIRAQRVWRSSRLDGHGVVVVFGPREPQRLRYGDARRSSGSTNRFECTQLSDVR